MLTGKQEKSAIIEGLSIGADDFLRKPVNFSELEASLKAGKRVLQLEKNLVDCNAKLERVLQAGAGFIICQYVVNRSFTEAM